MRKEYQIQYRHRNRGWAEATGMFRSTYSKREYAEEALALYLKSKRESNLIRNVRDAGEYRIAVREVGEWEEA